MPFSDPIADGPAIQRATERALAAGRHAVDDARSGARRARAQMAAPIVLFTYVNPVTADGRRRRSCRAPPTPASTACCCSTCRSRRRAGMRQALDARGIDLIFLVSPTTTDARLAEAARLGRGISLRDFPPRRHRRARRGGDIGRAARRAAAAADGAARGAGFRHFAARARARGHGLRRRRGRRERARAGDWPRRPRQARTCRRRWTRFVSCSEGSALMAPSSGVRSRFGGLASRVSA